MGRVLLVMGLIAIIALALWQIEKKEDEIRILRSVNESLNTEISDLFRKLREQNSQEIHGIHKQRP